MRGQEIFADRADAGRQLAAELADYVGRNDVVVLALPGGGVPVAYEVARFLGAPLDLLIVRRLGVPGYEELAMGAVAGGGVCVVDDEVVGDLRIPARVVSRVAAREAAEVERRERACQSGRPAPDLRGKMVILVDDGIATGCTMRAALGALRGMGIARIVVAAPVAPPSTCRMLREVADEVVCLETPEPFTTIGQWYRSFPQTSEDEVRELLARAAPEAAAGPA